MQAKRLRTLTAEVQSLNDADRGDDGRTAVSRLIFSIENLEVSVRSQNDDRAAVAVGDLIETGLS
jgi:hypothetical protein